MLFFFYHRTVDIATLHNLGLAKNVIQCLELYRVADKYDFPGLITWSAFHYRTLLDQFLDATSALQSPEPSELAAIVLATYQFAEEIPMKQKNLRLILLDRVMGHPKFRVVQPVGELHSLVLRVAGVIAKFGSDLFLVTVRHFDIKTRSS